MFEKIQLWFSSIFKKTEKIEEVKKLDTKKYVSKHAQLRFQERHGVLFTNDQAKSIVNDILFKKAQFVKIQPGETELWIASCDGKKYRVIYSIKNKIIVTVYSGLKDKKRKPSRKLKFRADNGKRGKSTEAGPIPVAYKRNKRVKHYDRAS